jgi:hypothetical protein
MLELWVRYRKYSRLLLVLLASFALLAFQHSRPEGQWLAEGVAAVTAPVQAAFARVHRVALGGWTTYLEWKALRADARTNGTRRTSDSGRSCRSGSASPCGPSAPRWWPGSGTASPAA